MTTMPECCCPGPTMTDVCCPVHGKDAEVLPMWVVYDHPSDYPEQYVARQHVVGVAGDTSTDRLMAAESLDNIRAALANLGLVCLTRNPQDDPVIVEVWL
jgi:hypothetical protein